MPKQLVSELKEAGVAKDGHWVLTSGRHALLYVQKEVITLKPALYRRVIVSMAGKCMEFDFQMLTGPALVGSILASPLSIFTNKPFVFPEKVVIDKQKIMRFRDVHAKAIPGQRLVISEDIVTTGGSVEQVIKAVCGLGGEVVAVMAIWNRGDFKPRMWRDGQWAEEIPFEALVNERIDDWPRHECPACLGERALYDPKTGQQVA